MRTIGLLLLLVCATSVTVPAQEGQEDDTVRAIRALEHAWTEGQSRNDNRALNLIFDNALVYIEYGKTMTKGEYLARVRLAGPNPPQIEMEAMSVRIFEDAAIVVGTYEEKSATKGKIVPKRWRFVDTWVKKKSGWLLVSAGSAPMSK